MNPLTSIPAALRRRVYAAYAWIGLAIGGTQVGYTAAQTDQPTWLIVMLAVFAYLGIGLGITAASNTPAPTHTD